MKNSIWMDFDTSGLLIIFGVAVIIYVAIFLSLLGRNGMIRALAAGAGGWLSTMVAFRWIWSSRYDWEQYLVSLRPMFQTISFLYVIVGPLPPLLGMPQYVSNYGVKDFYWVLYLASPLAFLAYEYGYELGLGKLASEIRLPNLKSDIKLPSSMLYAMFFVVVGIYYYMSVHIGFYAGGFRAEFRQTQGEFIKILGFLFNGFAAVALLLAFINYEKGAFYHKLLSIAIITTVVLFSVFMHNRRNAIYFVVICLSLVQMIRKIKFIKAAIILVLPIILIYVVTTVLRVGLPSDYDTAGVSFMDKLVSSKEVLATGIASKKLFEHGKLDVGYHLDAFDEAAAVLKSHEMEGIPYMWGDSSLMAVYQAVPGIFAPFPKEDEEEMLCNHFRLEPFDQLSNLYSTPIADFGILGIPIAFLVLGLIDAWLWRHWSKKKTSGLLGWGAKCAYFAIIPYLLSYEDFAGGYIAINFRYWLVYIIIFATILGCLTFFQMMTSKKEWPD
jgi:hypothetical protein